MTLADLCQALVAHVAKCRGCRRAEGRGGPKDTRCLDGRSLCWDIEREVKALVKGHR